jgi:pimeloyl-ACP methyl ester carboxylesterase
MTTLYASLGNSTTVRSLLPPLPLLRAYFAIVSWLAPELARRQAERLFTTPPRYRGKRVAPAVPKQIVDATGHRLAVWETGRREAPAVLLTHGWGGRSAQMASFIAPLTARGFRVVWFDQPGHGESGHGRVGLPDFVRAIEAVARTHGPFEAAIGHSLGGAALGLALRNGLSLGRVVLVSAPSSMHEHTRNFARLLGLAPRVRDAMRRHIEQRYGVRFDDIDRTDDLANVTVPALFVHDRNDTEIAFRHAERLSERMPRARLVTTYGLGHYRILREPGVVQTVVDFVAGSDDAPREIPPLPRPAPMY